MKTVAELKDGDHVNSEFLVNAANKGVTANGRNYLTVSLQDSSGSIESKKWDVDPEDEDIFVPGNIVGIEGEVIFYKNGLQMKILRAEKLPIDGIDFSRFVLSAPVPKAKMEEDLQSYLDSFTNPDVKKLTEYIIKKYYSFYVSYPAAVRNHHAFEGGLLYHSLSMANAAEALCKLYPSLNRDVLIAGTLIHDIGKTIELSGPVATKFTLEGKLLGHISIMQAEVREAAHELKMEGEIPTVMEHMVLSHHGKPEYGSAVQPETREALALSMIDDFDAKMNILDKAYQNVAPGEWTQRVLTMDDRVFYNPLYNGNK